MPAGSQWRKFLISGILLVLLMLQQIPRAWAVEAVLFEMADPKGDDFGPGTYLYPTGSVFDPKKGLFDLVKFKVTADERFYYFDTTMAKVTNPWGAPEGFSHPIINIYIDSAPNQGKTETFQEGAFVDLDSRHGWEYFIKVAGWNNTAIYEYHQPVTSKGQQKGIGVRLLDDGKTIRVKIPQGYLKNPENWYYYVLVGSQDGLGPDNYRQVMEKRTEWLFGGGTDTNYDPNVIDLLAPEKGDKSQKAQLGSYSLEKGTLAVISPVGADRKEVEEALKKIGKLARVEAEVKDVFSPILNKYPLARFYPVYIAAGTVVVIILLLGWVNFGKYFKNR